MAEATKAPLSDAAREAIRRRQLKVDVTKLSQVQRDNRIRLIALGQVAFGDKWRTDLANALGAELGREISTPQMAHWISGHRPIPDRVMEVTWDVSMTQAKALRKRAAVLSTLSWMYAGENPDGSVDNPEPPPGWDRRVGADKDGDDA